MREYILNLTSVDDLYDAAGATCSSSSCSPTRTLRIIGTHHRDIVYGSPWADVVFGLGGDDIVFAGDGNDVRRGTAHRVTGR